MFHKKLDCRLFGNCANCFVIDFLKTNFQIVLNFENLSSMDQEEYVPYVSLDHLNDPKSFTFRQKVIKENKSNKKKF